MHPRHIERINKYGVSYSIVEIGVRRLATVLAEHHISEIHYLSVDTEGGEAEGLASIDLNAVTIHVITVEANYNEARDKIDAMLFRNFKLVGQHGQDLYLINRRSPFISKAPDLRTALSSRFKSYRVRQFRRLAGRAVRRVYPNFRVRRHVST